MRSRRGRIAASNTARVAPNKHMKLGQDSHLEPAVFGDLAGQPLEAGDQVAPVRLDACRGRVGRRRTRIAHLEVDRRRGMAAGGNC